jgi:predicted metalloprotease
MRTRTLVAAAAISSVLTLVVGCASSIPGSASAQSTSVAAQAVPSSSVPASTVTVVPPSTVTQTVTASPEPTTPPAPSTVTVPDPGTTSDAQIRTEVAAAVTVVDQYWQNLFSTWHGPDGGPVYWWTPQLYHGDGFYDSALGVPGPICNGESVGPDNASFCPEGYGLSGFGSMSWDMELFRPFAAQGNDTVYYMVVAHESAHAAQARFTYDDQGPAVLDDTSVARETQADCIAGATLAKAAQDGYLTIEAGDQEEIQAVMVKFGDYEHDHGTPEQRYSAFEQGYQTADIESCLGQR